MVEQVVNMKKRYYKVVERFTKEDFIQYFAEFFAIHSCVTAVKWKQVDGEGIFFISRVTFELGYGYVRNHPALQEVVEDRGYDVLIYKIGQHDKVKHVELYEAVQDMRQLLEGVDVFEHVFGGKVDVSVTREELTVSKWGDEDATG